MDDAKPTTSANHGMSSKQASLLALLLLVPAPGLGTAAAMILLPGTAVGQALFFACKVWILAVPVVWLLAVERARPSWSPARRGGFLVAGALGLACGAAIVAAYCLLGPRLIDADTMKGMAQSIGLGSPAVYIAGAVYWITVNSLLEEYVWRWFVFRRCEALTTPMAAVVLSALFFTVHHIVALSVYFNWVANSIASFGIFVGGAVWSWCYLRYRSIWPGYLSHAIADVAVFAAGYHLIFC